MTRKHFEAIAAAIFRVRRDWAYDDNGPEAIDDVAGELATYFQTVNGLFDRSRFLAACRGEPIGERPSSTSPGTRR